MIRSAYDLFRLDLLEKFRLKMPTNSIEEFHIWNNLNELISQGQHSLTFEQLEYNLKDGQKIVEQKEAINSSYQDSHDTEQDHQHKRHKKHKKKHHGRE